MDDPVFKSPRGGHLARARLKEQKRRKRKLKEEEEGTKISDPESNPDFGQKKRKKKTMSASIVRGSAVIKKEESEDELDLSGDSIILEVDEDLANEFNQTTPEEEDEEEEQQEEKRKNKLKLGVKTGSSSSSSYFNQRLADSPETARSAIHKRSAFVCPLLLKLRLFLSFLIILGK